MLSGKNRNEIEKILSEMNEKVTVMFFRDKENQFESILDELSKISNKVIVEKYYSNSEEVKKLDLKFFPSIIFKERQNVRFIGLPLGYEFSVFLRDIVSISNNKIDLSLNVAKKISKIDKKINIKVFVTPSCPYCPKAVYIAHQFALLNNNIVSEMVESTEFPELAEKYEVYAVPKVVINEKVEFEGSVPEDFFADKVLEACMM
jgi:glutaredoxin-like protein